MANAYKVKQDTTLPRAVASEEHEGKTYYQTESVTYAAGDYVLEEDISPPFLEAGDLDDFLESADRDEAENALRAGAGYATFVAEHSNEAFILDQYGHTVVPREQVVELAAAGAEASAKASEEAKADGADERDLPGLPEEEVPEEQVPAERPPGIAIGQAAAEAAGAEPKKSGRAKPQAKAKSVETTGAAQAPVGGEHQQSAGHARGRQAKSE